MFLIKENSERASRPSEHSPAGGKNVKTLKWDHRLQRQKTSSWHLIGFLDGSDIGPTVLYRGETHTVCMYACMVITYSRVWINRVRLPILLVVS